MRDRLRRVFSVPLRESGHAYIRGVGKHWATLAVGLLSLVGATQVVFAFSLPYWVWLLIASLCLSWAQVLAYHDVRVRRDAWAEEASSAIEARAAYDEEAVALRRRVTVRDLMVELRQELGR